MAYLKYVGKADPNKYKDSDSFHDVINYITNPMKAVAVDSVNINRLEIAALEMDAVTAHARKASGKNLCHIVITFSPDELKNHSPAMVNDIARRCLLYFGSHYQAVFAIHQYPHRHIHIVVNRVSPFDFKRFPDRYENREHFWTYLYHILCNYNIRLWKN